LIFPENSELFQIKPVFLLTFLLCAVFFSCSTEDAVSSCKKPDCVLSQTLPGVLRKFDEKNGEEYFLIKENGFKKIDLSKIKGVPFAYDPETKRIATKEQRLDSFFISTVDTVKNSVVMETVFPDTVTAIFSGCFLDDGSLVVILRSEGEDLGRKYFLSISDKEDLSEWNSYLVREESRNDIFANMLLLETVFERPVNIQCSGDRLYLSSFTYFHDMMQVNIYRFSVSERKFYYETGYFPLGVNDEKVTVFFNESNKTGYINQKRDLIMVRGSDSPKKTVFNEPGEIFFSPTDQGLMVLFVPESLPGSDF